MLPLPRYVDGCLAVGALCLCFCVLGGVGRVRHTAPCYDGGRERRVLGGIPRPEAASTAESRPEAKTTRATTTAWATTTTTCACAAAPARATCRAALTHEGRLDSASGSRERDAGATGSSRQKHAAAGNREGPAAAEGQARPANATAENNSGDSLRRRASGSGGD